VLCGTIFHAAKRAKVQRSTVYLRRDTNPEFATAMACALEDADDGLEEVARKRAKKKSDRLLIFLLGARRYKKEVTHKVAPPDGQNGNPISIVEVVRPSSNGSAPGVAGDHP
jgi:hypothetical protein